MVSGVSDVLPHLHRADDVIYSQNLPTRPTARPLNAMAMALPLSSGSVYILETMVKPKEIINHIILFKVDNFVFKPKVTLRYELRSLITYTF